MKKQIASIMASVILIISAGVVTHKEATQAESPKALAQWLDKLNQVIERRKTEWRKLRKPMTSFRMNM